MRKPLVIEASFENFWQIIDVQLIDLIFGLLRNVDAALVVRNLCFLEGEVNRADMGIV